MSGAVRIRAGHSGLQRQGRPGLGRRWPALIALALGLLTLGLLMQAAVLQAADLLPAGPTHRGIVPSGTYQIFPENRPGNGVYEEGVLVFSLPDDIIVSVAGLAPQGRFIYVARTGQQQRTLAVHMQPRDPTPRMTEISKGYVYVVGGLDGVGYKKFFRVQDRSVVDLLTASRTADGLTVGAKGIAFYHVNRAEPAPDGTGQRFGLRLHLALFGQERARHLGQDILNAKPALKLAWLDDSTLQVTLADGSTRTVEIAEFR